MSTADEPSIHIDNVTGHPGSSFAGAGIIAAVTTILSVIHGTPLPQSGPEWGAYVVTIALAVLAALGK
jgi:hypothetical protein